MMLQSIKKYAPLALLVGVLLAPGTSFAAAKLSVKPNTHLSNGQRVVVSGSGFKHGSTGSILECNNDPKQPTVKVAGNPVPVSCSNPLESLVTTTAKGTLTATAFTIKKGTVGAPATGKDSSGRSAAADAKEYPCPATAAQKKAGYSCEITFGDQGGDDVSAKINFR